MVALLLGSDDEDGFVVFVRVALGVRAGTLVLSLAIAVLIDGVVGGAAKEAEAVVFDTVTLLVALTAATEA